MAAYHLVVFHTPGLQRVSDFLTVREKMAVCAPDIAMYINSPSIRFNERAWSRLAEHPTALFSPRCMLPLATSIRGVRLIPPSDVHKFDECALLAAAGFPVPKTESILPETVFDEADWGPFIVVKPKRGQQGDGVLLHRTRDLRWRDTKTLPAEDPRHGKELLAQQYIHTGPFATCYRVMTVLGRAVYSVTSIAGVQTPDLDPEISGPLELPIAANTKGRRMQLNYDEEVISLAQDIHRKLTYTPVMGVDIIREHGTGKLYVLELNSRGMTWNLSSDHGLRLQQMHGTDYAAQFGALDIITERLVDATRRLAV